MNRGCGLYAPISILPNKYGYGCFSKEAYDFIDYLSSLNIKYWQVDSINSLGSVFVSNIINSSFAGDPLYIDIEKYLSVEEIEFFKLNKNISLKDYKIRKDEALRYIFDKMYYTTNLDKFIENNESWIYDYAVFMAMKDEFKSPYKNFLDEYKNLDSGETISFIKTHSEEIVYYIFLQYLFFKQWKELKRYANLRGIKIISNNNIIIGDDNADVYSNRNLFNLDNDSATLKIENLKLNKYSYLINKYKFISKIYDYVIINYDETISVQDFKDIQNVLENSEIKNIFYDNNYYNFENDENIINNNDGNFILNKKSSEEIFNNEIKSNYVINNVINGFLYNEKNNIPNNYNKKVISYIGNGYYKPLYYYLKSDIIFEKISNYLNLKHSVDINTVLKLIIENTLASNANIVIINIKDIFTEITDYYFRLKDNYQDNNLFCYLKELIKNKNR